MSFHTEEETEASWCLCVLMMDTNSQNAVLSLVSFFICVLSKASPDDVVEDMLLQFFLSLWELQLVQTEVRAF